MGAPSVSIDASDREKLTKFCDAFKLSKEIGKPNVNDDDGFYELSIWLVDRSYFNLLIIFTEHDGAVIRNGTKYYRNEEFGCADRTHVEIINTR